MIIERRRPFFFKLPHIEAAPGPRLDQAPGQQLVVGRHHGGRIHTLGLGTLAHAGQAGTRRQQAVADALRQPLRKLLGQRLGRGFQQHGHGHFLQDNRHSATRPEPGTPRVNVAMFCMETATHTEHGLIGLSVWLVYGLPRYIGSLCSAFIRLIRPATGMYPPCPRAHHHPESAP